MGSVLYATERTIQNAVCFHVMCRRSRLQTLSITYLSIVANKPAAAAAGGAMDVIIFCEGLAGEGAGLAIAALSKAV